MAKKMINDEKKDHSILISIRINEISVRFTFCVCRNLYGLVKTEICINSLLSSLLDIQEQEK